MGKKITSISIDEDLYELVKKYGINLSGLIERYLRNYFYGQGDSIAVHDKLLSFIDRVREQVLRISEELRIVIAGIDSFKEKIREEEQQIHKEAEESVERVREHLKRIFKGASAETTVEDLLHQRAGFILAKDIYDLKVRINNMLSGIAAEYCVSLAVVKNIFKELYPKLAEAIFNE